MKKIKIICIDDHPLILEGISMIIKDEFDYDVFTSSNGLEALEIIKKEEIDLAIIDIKMPHMNGIDLLKILVDDFPKVKSLMCSMSNEFITVNECFKIGCNGFLSKELLNRESLTNAINSILIDEVYADSIALKTLRKSISNSFQLDTIDLEILSQLSMGNKQSDVAKKLDISISSTEKKIKKMLEMFDAKNTTEAVVLGIKNNYI